jgi:AcrR family transcriptional regulator
MADPRDAAWPGRLRRADARRSIDAILRAARTVLGERPDASMEDIATAADVTRQTVYAHFPSRDALVAALLHAAGAETVAAIDTARLDTIPPAAALRQFLDIGWQLIRRNPHLLGPALTRNAPGSADPHHAGAARLEQIIRRGQRAGDFDRAPPATWLAAAILGLFRAAAEQVADGRLALSEAAPMLLDSALRLCGVADARCQARAAPAADPAAGDDIDVAQKDDRSAGRTTPA